MDTNTSLYRPPAPYPSREGAGDFDGVETNLLRHLPEELYKSDIVDISTPDKPNFLINDPELLSVIFEDKPEIFVKSDGMIELLRPLLGDHPLVTSNNRCVDQRAMIKPIGSTHTQQVNFGHIQSSINHFESFCEEIQNENRVIDLSHLLRRLNADIAYRMLFSIELPKSVFDDINTHARDFETRISQLIRETAEKGVAWQLPKVPQQAVYSAQQLRYLVSMLIDGNIQSNHFSHNSFLHKFLVARSPETNIPFTRKQLVDHVTTILNSQELAAAVLMWALFVLSQCPDCRQKIREEVCRVAGHGDIQFEHLSRLRYTRNVFREVLRLYPPIPHLTRKTNRAIKLGRLDLPEGAQITISPWIIHRHQQYWFNPDRFDPERFIKKDHHIIMKSFLPFGRGLRMCTGASSAILQGTLILARLVSQFDIEVLNPDKVEPEGVLFLEPLRPVVCKVTRIKHI
ncbi:cytochrome P450 [Pseudovibrio sp. Tun.PSC04-5.I4]|uniref:cytochrome P450 n=1 Tax=Pseudovibrio sp. Tun.PSC04-5.I4 TaxID=1798213 RepID=UPI00088E972C|nr:cytochrome P450 [Pseudovibrio sp. Tun.PSC04-5.I4]SDQ22181.1 Cytochrome P450 [Pseudovibrio sp. Tun.PSC04-5.I4]